MRSFLSRAVAVAAVTTLGATLLAGPAQAAPRDARAASWLADELTDGLASSVEYGVDNYGLTADIALAFAEIGVQRRAMVASRRALAQHVHDYAGAGDEVYAGATAKLLLVAQETGGNPRNFGGVDLVERLSERVSTTGVTKGRIQDKSAWGDYANTIGQVLATQGLTTAGSPRARAVRDYLLAQQCTQGFFRLNFSDPTATDQTCSGAAKADRQPDTDVTAMAVIALQDLDRKGPKVRVSLRKATRWLKRSQADNGGFAGGATTEGLNANSTGLAARALGVRGACRPAKNAAVWVRKRQIAGFDSGPLADENGAIAYDQAAKRAARADGITDTTRDQFVRTTAQAAPGLVWLRLRACQSGR